MCSGCHRPAPGYDHLNQRGFEFVPLWGCMVVLLYCMRRVDCRTCGVRVEAVPWGIGKHQLTKAYMLFLAHWARKLSWQETAVSFRTTWDKVCQSVEYVVQWGIEHRQLGPIVAIGVDEIQYAKGHKYLTLVYQIEQHCTRLLWIGRERTVASFEQFFVMIGEELAGQIAFVCSDMWQPYLTVIRERCSQAIHILDRFHIVAKMNTALDQVRAGEARQAGARRLRACLEEDPLVRAEAPGKPDQATTVPPARPAALQLADRASLSAEGGLPAVLGVTSSPSWAGKFLDEWCCQVMRSRIEPMKKIARTLRSHRALILNYFRARKQFSSGVVEGLNNKAKLTMRKSYGFRTFHVTETALYHALGKLPEPDVAAQILAAFRAARTRRTGHQRDDVRTGGRLGERRLLCAAPGDLRLYSARR